MEDSEKLGRLAEWAFIDRDCTISCVIGPYVVASDAARSVRTGLASVGWIVVAQGRIVLAASRGIGVVPDVLHAEGEALRRALAAMLALHA